MNKEIEYLKEHLYEIYKYKKSMIDLTYDMDIEHLLRTSKALDYQQKEIERLNNNWNELEQVIKNYKYTNTCRCYSCNKELCDILLDKIKELKGEDKK